MDYNEQQFSYSELPPKPSKAYLKQQQRARRAWAAEQRRHQKAMEKLMRKVQKQPNGAPSVDKAPQGNVRAQNQQIQNTFQQMPLNSNTQPILSNPQPNKNFEQNPNSSQNNYYEQPPKNINRQTLLEQYDKNYQLQQQNKNQFPKSDSENYLDEYINKKTGKYTP